MANPREMTELSSSTQNEPVPRNTVRAMTDAAPVKGRGKEGENEGVPINSESQPPKASKKDYWPLAIFLLLYYIGVVGLTTLLPQYILARLRILHVVNMTGDVNDSCALNESDPILMKERHVEKLTSWITSIAAFCRGVPAFLTVLIYSSMSDHMGRRITIIIPYIGSSIAAILIAFVISLELPFWVLYIAYALNGLCGSQVTLIAGAFASIADVTTPDERSISIGILQGALGLATLVGNLAVGKWVASSGFRAPMIFLASMTAGSGLMFWEIRETNPSSNEVGRPSLVQVIKRQWQHLVRTLTLDKHRAKKLCLLACGFAISEFVGNGSESVLTVYVLGRPFCMSSVHLGYYKAFKVAVVMVGTTVAIAYLRQWAKDVTLALFGMLSFILYCVFTAASSIFSGTLALVLLGIGVPAGAISGLHLITIRAISSNEVSAAEQGAVFGLIAIGEAFSTDFGPVVYGAIYGATVASMTWFVFLLSVLLYLVALTLIIIYWITVKRSASVNPPEN